MKILKAWLQNHIEETLPSDEKIAEAFILKSAEVEGVENSVFDLKVLPDRAHYMLSHRGVAYDLSAILNLSLKSEKISLPEKGNDIEVKVESDLCSRYSATVISNITNTASPEWLKTSLENIGSRSINALVDATNYAMFDTGQPLHAFDLDKVKGGLSVRFAKEGEKMETLSGQVIALKTHHLVIADNEGPLALAGVKGGKRAEVTMDTKNIVLEAAHFNPISVRKTSFEVGIRNDSSKRFENEITPYLVEKGVSKFLEVLKKISPDAKVGHMNDVFKKLPESWIVKVNHAHIESILNYSLPEKRVVEILEKLQCKVSLKNGVYEVIPPFERLDLIIAEDIIDEVGRIEGLDKIKSIVPNAKTVHTFSQEFLLAERIKDFLVEKGFSEVMTRSFTNKGDIEVAYPMASDKGFLRTNIRDNVMNSIDLAVKNASLLGLDEVKIFEIGKIFTKEGEQTSLVVAIKNIKKKMEKEKEKIKTLRDELLNVLKVDAQILCTVDDTGGIISKNGKDVGRTNNIEGVMELTLDGLTEEAHDLSLIKIQKGSRTQFAPFSTEPFITRDIALFVDSQVNEKEVSTVISDSLKQNAGDLLVKGPDLFDTFEKEGKKSLAFRMIFQAKDRTMTDEETNAFMEKVYTVVKEKGWQVR